jgi:hypothetical protein
MDLAIKEHRLSSLLVSTEEPDALSDIESNNPRSNEDEVRMSHSQNHKSQYE